MARRLADAVRTGWTRLVGASRIVPGRLVQGSRCGRGRTGRRRVVGGGQGWLAMAWLVRCGQGRAGMPWLVGAGGDELARPVSGGAGWDEQDRLGSSAGRPGMNRRERASRRGLVWGGTVRKVGKAGRGWRGLGRGGQWTRTVGTGWGGGSWVGAASRFGVGSVGRGRNGSSVRAGQARVEWAWLVGSVRGGAPWGALRRVVGAGRCGAGRARCELSDGSERELRRRGLG